jgi:LDH2 family malate/lactate/ureidoglycolate dehydrogenase
MILLFMEVFMVESSTLPEGTVRFPHEFIRDFIAAAIRAVGVPDVHARLTADVLISADLRGVRSHGMGRLPILVDTLERGGINKNSSYLFKTGSNTTGVLDAENGLGPVASNIAMEKAISMAEEQGTGFVAVCNSSHMGYPGYWAKKAMDRGFIGLCMTNGGRFVTPTFGVEPTLGTNPFSIAIPGGPDGEIFHLDIATSTVARGKIETLLREEKPIPKGWVPEAYGPLRLDERGILPFEVPLLPLGGEGTETGGHKGFALSLMVELLCSILSGSGTQDMKEENEGGAEGQTFPSAGPTFPAAGHFMGAIKVDGFREPARVFAHMAEIYGRIRGSKKAPGHDRIYTPGELEVIAEEENRRQGVPITPAVLEQARRLNERLSLGFEL